MFENCSLAVDIGSDNIKILYGNSKVIKHFGLIKTPEESVSDNRILNTEIISGLIYEFLKVKKINTKKISFAISGQDIAVKHIEIPAMDEKSLINAVKWEINRTLPDNGENYNLDYEILDVSRTTGKKIYKVLAVSVPNERIDKYVELSKLLNLNLNAIDLSSNSIARVFGSIGLKKIYNKSIGIIDLGGKTTEVIIIENGKLFIERGVPFGRDNFVREISRRRQVESDEALRYLTKSFNFEKIDEDNEVDNRIRTLFDNVLSSFQKVIQFYTTGKTQKNLDEIYITGTGCEIMGIEKYISNYLNSPSIITDTPKKINKNLKLPKECNFGYFLSTYGILLRRDK